MNFCPRCDNIAIELTSGDELKFRCPTCVEDYDATPEATLLVSDNIGMDPVSKFRQFIKNSPHDPTNIKVLDKCEKCGNMVATHIRVTDQQKVLHTCKMCGNIWEPQYMSKPITLKGGGDDESRLGIFQRLNKHKSQIEKLIDVFVYKCTRGLARGKQEPFKKLIWKLIDVNSDDITAINKLREYYKMSEIKRPDTAGRSQSRIVDIESWLGKLTPFDDKYLDVGTSEASITESVAKYLNIYDKPEKAYGTDICSKLPSPRGNIEFATNTSTELPYDDAQFSLVTAFMSFHHFTHLEEMVEEIRRVMVSYGTLIIREHDSDSSDKAFATFLDFVHVFYALIASDESTPEEFSNITFYNSRDFWTKKLAKHGFKLVEYIDSHNPRTGTLDMFQSYYAKYTL